MASAQAPSSMLEMQHQIRANAANLQDYFSDLYSWEKAISQEDASRKKNKKSGGANTAPPPRARQSAVIGSVSDGDKVEGEKTRPADAHTYDKGYKRWDKFDVVRLQFCGPLKYCYVMELMCSLYMCVQEAALREADGDAQAQKEEAPAVGVSAGRVFMVRSV